ncbi:MAG: assimilatory sulfite reductase (NADPH) flavoprotein subunit [Verrucomicrobia bacterium]|nr:assimilatory sulfite reductase (NADPH) flavoprotein subunit [Verrucomicrobiota bacterium]
MTTSPTIDSQSGPLSGETTLTILYGSQTGNGKGVARQAMARAAELGLPAKLKDMGDYKMSELKKEKNLMVVVSTHGEGDPPDPAIELHEFLHGKRAPKLEGVNYSVLALGDSSYAEYCQTGADFDERLDALGATRLIDRVDCDVDFEDAAEEWIEKSLEAFVDKVDMSGPAGGVPTFVPVAAPKTTFNKKNPFNASLLEMINLNGAGSAKETWHVEVSLEGSGLTYQPGDSLGVFPTNPPEVVSALINALGLNPDVKVEAPTGEATLKDALSHSYEITLITRPVAHKYAELSRAGKLTKLLGDDRKDEFQEYIYGRDLIDLVNEFPVAGVSAQEFVGILRKLPPRLYSLASSLHVHPDEAHLTVAAVRFHSHGRGRKGVCSTYFADRIDEETEIPVYVDTNENFKMPVDPATPMIMVGPGTGVAPFRAFLEEREALGGTGRNWLFFGDQHFTTDFLYQIEWQRFLKDGILERMDVAFSRDQTQKIYVQHRMLERARDLYAWIEEGATLYVCGDESRMAHDVHEALVQIVANEGEKSREDAESYVKDLQKTKRYQRDVY